MGMGVSLLLQPSSAQCGAYLLFAWRGLRLWGGFAPAPFACPLVSLCWRMGSLQLLPLLGPFGSKGAGVRIALCFLYCSFGLERYPFRRACILLGGQPLPGSLWEPRCLNSCVTAPLLRSLRNCAADLGSTFERQRCVSCCVGAGRTTSSHAWGLRKGPGRLANRPVGKAEGEHKLPMPATAHLERVSSGCILALSLFCGLCASLASAILASRLQQTMQRDLAAKVAECLKTPRELHPIFDVPSGGRRVGQATQALLVPHSECVHLDRTAGGDHVLTNILTMESTILQPAGEWSLIFDSEGFGVCVPGGNSQAEAVLVDEVLQYAVYSANGDHIVLATSGPQQGHRIEVSSMLRKYVEVSIPICFGVPLTEHQFAGALLKWPRPPAARLMWSCKSLYESLALDQFRSAPWRWTFAGVPRWQKHMASLGMESHVLRSIQSEVVAGAHTHPSCSRRCQMAP